MKRPDHTDTGEARAGLSSTAEAASFEAAKRLLKQHLIHKREIPNGRDFLFSGPKTELHDALKSLVEIEHKRNRLLHLDYVQVDEYFLLRIMGSEEYGEIIQEYFERDEETKG